MGVYNPVQLKAKDMTQKVTTIMAEQADKVLIRTEKVHRRQLLIQKHHLSATKPQATTQKNSTKSLSWTYGPKTKQQKYHAENVRWHWAASSGRRSCSKQETQQHKKQPAKTC